jgi:hypothetical protein
MRLDKAINETWTVGVETYSDFGQFRSMLPWKQQSQNVWLVGDYSGNPISVEFGAGFGLTPASDSFALKLMLISDLTGEHSLFH